MTADSFRIEPGDVVQVVVDQPTPLGVVTVSGPQGPPGPAGPAYSSPAWWFDDGPPDTIIGAKPGDLYMNLLDGSIYRLGD